MRNDPLERGGRRETPVPVELRRALRYVAPYWRRLVLVLVLSLASTALALYLPYLSKDLIDRALVGRSWSSLQRIVLLFAAVTVAGFALNVASGLRYTRVSAEILFDMRLALYRHLQRLSPRFYARTRLGEIVARINNDIGEIQRVAAEAVLAWVGNVLFLAGTVAVLLLLDVRLFLASVSLVPLAVWALARYRTRLAARVATLRQASADVGSFLLETLQGMKLVVASNAEEREVGRFRDRNAAFIRALMAMQLATYLSGGLPGLILSGATMLVFLYGGSRVIDGSLTLGTFVAFVAYQMRLMGPIQGLMGLYASLATVKVSLRRVHELLDTAPEVTETDEPIPLPVVRGDISFDEVSLAFDRGISVLDRVAFSVRAGERLAIVGPSGGGKSTIADLLLRLLDPDAGVVRLDGHDLRRLCLADLRRHVVLVDQEPFVFHASIAENLRYARPDASDAELAAAARAAGLLEFIESLPQGAATIVGERGLALSAGERQRIAIARAILADPTILILDEATASLDPVTERRVIEGYEAVMRGRTTIIITHRWRMASTADRVAVLLGARIVEQGAPAELLTRRGTLADLFGEDIGREPADAGAPRR